MKAAVGDTVTSPGHGELENHHLAGEDVVIGVDQLDLHLVRAGRQPGDVDRVDLTRLGPQPRQVIDVDVQMPDPGRYLKGAHPEHGCDAHILHAVLRPEEALGQPCRNRRINDQLRRRLLLYRDVR
jgi:hypothetical protein